MDQVYEFVWSVEDFEDLLADLMAFQQDQIYDEYFQGPDFDVWAHLETWRGELDGIDDRRA